MSRFPPCTKKTAAQDRERLPEIYASLGEAHEVFGWLKPAYQERDGSMLFIKQEPKLKELRDNPRYAELIGRVELVARLSSQKEGGRPAHLGPSTDLSQRFKERAFRAITFQRLPVDAPMPVSSGRSKIISIIKLLHRVGKRLGRR